MIPCERPVNPVSQLCSVPGLFGLEKINTDIIFIYLAVYLQGSF